MRISRKGNLFYKIKVSFITAIILALLSALKLIPKLEQIGAYLFIAAQTVFLIGTSCLWILWSHAGKGKLPKIKKQSRNWKGTLCLISLTMIFSLLLGRTIIEVTLEETRLKLSILLWLSWALAPVVIIMIFTAHSFRKQILPYRY